MGDTATWQGIQDASPKPNRVWLSKVKESDPWEPLTKRDCQTINDRIEQNTNNTNEKSSTRTRTRTNINVEYGRSTVNLQTNEIRYNFYDAPVRQLCSAIWFSKIKRSGKDVAIPIVSTTDEMLMEHLYIQARDSLNAVNAVNDNDNNDGDGDGDGDYKGEDVALQDDEGYKIFIAKENNAWSLRKRPTAVLSMEGYSDLQRGYGDYTVNGEVEEEALGPVRHVSFVVHGIGEAMWSKEDMNFPSLLQEVKQMRITITKKMYESWKLECNRCERRGQPPPPPPNRIELIPIEWYDKIHASNSSLKNNLVSSTLAGVPKLRSIANDVIFDVLMYMTPEFCEEVLNCVTGQINELYDSFQVVNPGFSDQGSVSLIGHSLGSVIVWDILSILGDKLHKKEAAGTINDPICVDDNIMVNSYCLPNDDDSSTTTMQSTTSIFRTQASDSGFEITKNTGTWGPSTVAKISTTLPFVPKFTMFLGSPLGLFLALRCARPVFDKFRLSDEENAVVPQHVDACLQPSSPFGLPSKAVYNIFHPSDPVAYRIEPALLPEDLEASQIPKPCFLKVEGRRTRLNTHAQEFGDSLVKTVGAFAGLIQANILEKMPSQRTIDADAATAKSKRKKINGPPVYNFALGGESNRVDFQLQTGVVDNEYIAAISAHSSYYTNEDLLEFIIQCAHSENDE